MYMTAKGAGDFVINVEVTFDVDCSFHPEGKLQYPISDLGNMIICL
jgi:hypothetical protein